MNLVWTRDSVKGTGTYVVLENTLGCGGGALRGTGTLSLAAARAGPAVSGRFDFDSGWKPSYRASLQDSTHLVGDLQATDGATCPFSLFFGLVPQ